MRHDLDTCLRELKKNQEKFPVSGGETSKDSLTVLTTSACFLLREAPALSEMFLCRVIYVILVFILRNKECFPFNHNYLNVSGIIHYPTLRLLTISILFLYYVITATDYFRSARLFLLENKRFYDQVKKSGVQLIILHVLYFSNSHYFNIFDCSS